MRNDAVAAFKTAAALGRPDLTKISLLQVLQYGDGEKLSAAIIGREREFVRCHGLPPAGASLILH